MKKQLLYLSFLLLISLISCKKSGKKDCGNVIFTTVAFTADCRPVIIDKTTTDMFLVIHSLEELKSALHFENTTGTAQCGTDHSIFSTDFSRQTLIIIKKHVDGIDATLINQSLAKNCSDNSINYKAEIKNGGYTAMGNYIGAILIDKIADDTKVNFDVKVVKE